MDTYGILHGKENVAPNPNYNNKTKKLGAKPFIPTTDPQFDITESLVSSYTQGGGASQVIDTGYNNEQLEDYGITPSLIDTPDSYRDMLADAQSNWTKAFNSLGQTLFSELMIGIPKSMSDIVDAIGQATGLSDKDYTNPVSEFLENTRETINNDVFPIYTRTDSGITNPDLGWIFSSIPSIASSLTLLYPTRFTMGAIKAVGKALHVGQGVRKTIRALSMANKAKTFEELNAFQKGLNSTAAITGTNAALELGTSALIMRTMENYQEARQSYENSYLNNLEYLNQLDDIEYEKWLVSHEELIGNLVDKSRDNVAKFIAQNAADKTFAIDYANVVFDAIQLWGLRNFAKNIGKIKQNTSRVANEEQAISVATAGKEAAEATKIAADLIDKTPKYLRYIKYGGKQFLKTGFAESTEGVEEAVNYIAQEEGITYGKILLGTETPTAFNDRLVNYMKSPDLYDAALWGTIGGMVFHEVGSISEARRLYKKAKESKARQELNANTGESVISDDFIDYLEMADNNSAVSAIRNRNILLNNTINKLKQIEDNKNIFAAEPGKEVPEFEGDVEAQKALAKERVLNEFITDVGLESINSGTFDLLEEYIKDENVKKVFVDNGFAKQEEANVFSNNLIQKLENIKSVYSGQLEHVRNQATYINTREDSNLVRPEYIQIIAKENTNHLLNIRDLSDRLKVLQTLENSENIDDETFRNLELHRQAIDANSLATSYAQLTGQIEQTKKDKSLNAIQKQIVIEDINSKRRIVLAELARKYGHGELLMALRLADRINPETLEFDDNLATKTDLELIKDFDKLAEFEEVDKLLRHSGKTLTRFRTSGKTVDEIVEEAQKVYEDYKYKFGVNALARRSKTLAERFTDESILSLNIAEERSKIKQTTEEIQSRIDALHNQMNEARKQALIPATEIISKLYDKYGENFNKVIDVVKTAYTDGINNARKLAKDTLDEQDVDSLIQAISIFNFSNDENALILKYISALIDRKDRENKIITQVTSASNPVPTDVSASSATPVNQPVVEDVRNRKHYKVKVDRKGTVHISGSKNDNGIEGRVNEDGSVELMYSELPISSLGKILSTEYFDTPNFDILENDFKIGKNPVVKKDDKGHYTVVERGKLEKISSPVEESGKGDVANANQQLAPEGTAPLSESIPASDGQPVPASDGQVDIVTPGQSLTPKTEEPEAKPKQIIQTNASIEDILDDITNSDAINYVLSSLTESIERFGDNLDVAQIKENILKTHPKEFDSDIISKLFDYYSEFYISAEDLTDNMSKNNSNALDNAAVQVVMASKFTDSNSGFYSSLFSNTLNDFIELYINTLPGVIIDGKQAINVNDLFDLCNKIAKKEFNTNPNALFEVISGWLTSSHNTKYKVIGDVENMSNTNGAINKEDLVNKTNEYRIEIKGSYENPLNTNAVTNVKAGDVLRVSTSRDGITLIDKDNYCVGRMPIPYRVYGSKFIANVGGFYMDLDVDANGKIISSIKNVFERIFLGTDPDAAALRGLLYNEYSDVGLADAFATNPIISKLFNDTIANATQTDRGTYYNGPLYMRTVGGKPVVDYDRIFKHLKNVFRYTAGINEGNYEDNKTLIKLSIDSYFSEQYNSYKAAVQLSNNPVDTVTVVRATQGELVKVVQSTEGQYSKLTPITSAIANGQSALLGVTDPYQAGKIYLSDGNTCELKGMNAGSTLLLLNVDEGNNKIKRVPVKAFGVRLDDDEIENPLLQEIIEALYKEIDRVCDKFVDKSISMSERIGEINRFLTRLFDASKKNNINVLQGHNGIFRVVTTTDPNNPNPTRTVVNINNADNTTVTLIFNTLGQYNTEVASVSALANIQVGNTVKPVANTLLKAGQTDATILKASLKQLIAKNTAISLSAEGFRLSDGVSQTSDANAYFKIQNVNGKPKFVVELGEYRKEFDSYESFLMSNNMLRVNTKVENGHNFRVEGGNQINNKIITIDVPSVPKTIFTTTAIDSANKKEIHILPNASATQFEDYVNIIRNPSIRHKGRALLEAVTPQYVFDDNPDLLELIDELLPSHIVYDENYNDIEEENGKLHTIGNIAQVNVGTTGRYNRYRQKRKNKQGKTTYSRGTISHGSVVVGDALVNLLAGTINEKREGIVKLIHERLHYIIHNNKDFKASDIINSLQDIYITFFDKFDEYCKRLDNGDASVAKALGGRAYIEQWRTYYSKKIFDKLNNERKLEEFLVETLTSPSFMLFANEVELENINTKKESIFDKILNFITKFIFNLGNHFIVKDNSLLRKELNTLADVISGNISKTENKEEPTSSPVEEHKKDTPADKIETEKDNDENDENDENDDDDDELVDIDDAELESLFKSFASDEKGYAIFDSLTSRPNLINDNVEINDDSLRDMVSVNEVFAGLNHKDNLNLHKCLADGTFSYVCR